MGYFSITATSDDSYDEDAVGFLSQFKPSSTGLPALGNIPISGGNVFGISPAAKMDGGTAPNPWGIFNTPVKAPVKAPIVAPLPVKPIVSTPVGGGLINSPANIPPPIIDWFPTNTPKFLPAAPTATPTQQQAQSAADNATTLQQQAAVAQAAGNTQLAQQLNTQAISWSDINKAITSAIPTASVASANLIPTDSSAPAPAPAAGVKFSTPVILAISGGVLALLFLVKK